MERDKKMKDPFYRVRHTPPQKVPAKHLSLTSASRRSQMLSCQAARVALRLADHSGPV